MFTRKTLLKTTSCLLLLACILLGSFPQINHAEEDLLDFAEKSGFPVKEPYRPKASIVIDADSGQILWEDQPDLSWSPASIAKVMTMYLAFEAMEQEKFNLDTTVTATEQYVAISQIYALSNNKISLGVDYPVRDLFSMVAVPSSNVATLMLANLVSDNDEADFIRKMNDKAAELGMSNTTYFNCSGAQISAFDGLYQAPGIDPNGENKSTARDLAILTYNLIKKYPDILQFTSKPVVKTMPDTPYEETFETYNYSLPGAKYGYDGVDGLKTGSSPTGAFNYIATAKKGDVRLIEVILGVGDWSDQAGEYERHLAGNAILDHAFSTYEYKKLLSKGPNTIDQKEIILEQDFYGFIKKNTEPSFTLKDGQLALKSDYGQVSPEIPVQTVSYQESEPKAVDNESVKKNTRQPSTTKNADHNYLVSSILAVFGILLLVFSRVFRKRVAGVRRGSRKTSTTTTRLLFTVGVLLILSAISVWIFL
ncbi:D-alanyl-D-alanine carboxypeptidase [Enterococcus silesiacus]|uniref:D-alanyl-D-alanine carboxypeptidase n=1 Tax=Enterococcus silesiacus TaxID=332949 RepID=A0A0S3KD41_9ENTE|nr:DUF1958 domain-containing protein [Enterococcus silesiacus]ALS02237.1 D-alanyl-D-alanine carboxypeptidase [Enterococcus silesiacus]OJG92405.1 hypothetical protein RV15_GL003198 [Enterococcus silesiacus]